jgi:hypothetical protein
LDDQLASVLLGHGCKAVLRATYLDQSGTVATTVGVVVMPSPAQAETAIGDETFGTVPYDSRGVRAVDFPGTAVASFKDSARQYLEHASTGTAYILLATSGWVDGRSGLAHELHSEYFADGQSLISTLTSELAVDYHPCKLKAVQC